MTMRYVKDTLGLGGQYVTFESQPRFKSSMVK